MDWLKRILGEEQYKLLELNGTIATLKIKLGEYEYIPNDPTKIIPKHVFNEKIAENKLLKTENEQYKTRLNDVGDMVTSQDMKTKLETQKIEFETMISNQKNEFDKNLETNNKSHMVKNLLAVNGVNANFLEMMSNQVNMDEVIIQDGKILNQDKIILPMKSTYKQVFDNKVTGNTPPANHGTPPPTPSTKQELINKYNEYEKTGDFIGMTRIDRQIKSLKE